MSTIINATTTNGVVIQPDNSGSLVLQTNNGTTALTIDTSQRAAFVAGTAAAPAITTSGDTNTGMFFPAADTIAFTEGGTEAMRLDSGGYIQIGATAKSSDEQLYVNQSANGTSIISRVGGASSSSNPALKTIKFTNVNNSSQIHVTFTYNNGGNGNGAIVGNGDSQAAFATFSDKRLKENIENLPSQLDKITALRPVEFDYIKSGEHQIGFIAQEVKEVYPDLVAEGENTMLTVVGLGKTEARLIKAIQEQQAIINDLKARIETLEAK